MVLEHHPRHHVLGDIEARANSTVDLRMVATYSSEFTIHVEHYIHRVFRLHLTNLLIEM